MDGDFGLYLILTDPVVGYQRCAEAAVAQCVPFLQLRIKEAPDSQVRTIAQDLRALTRNTATKFIINDDVDLAMMVDADGVHLGQTDLPLAEARRRWNTSGKIFGLSTHTPSQASQASGADYIGVGPVFATPTKPDGSAPLGIAATAAITHRASLPCVAIGGINQHNLPDLLRAGCRNFAVVRAVCQSQSPAVAIQQLTDQWRAYRGCPSDRVM